MLTITNSNEPAANSAVSEQQAAIHLILEQFSQSSPLIRYFHL